MTGYFAIMFAVLNLILLLIALVLFQRLPAPAPAPARSRRSDVIKLAVTDDVLQQIGNRLGQGYEIAHIGRSYVVLVKEIVS